MKNKLILIILALSLLVVLGYLISWKILSTRDFGKMEAKQYINKEYKFTINYPSSWIIQQDNLLYVVLVPSKEEKWEPSSPQDIPKEPRIRIDMGKYIKERFGSQNFPEDITYSALKDWLQKKIASGEFKDFSEKEIGGFPFFGVTEYRDPGCERVIYWRPNNLVSLLRIATGCESNYLDDFYTIVNSLKETEKEWINNLSFSVDKCDSNIDPYSPPQEGILNQRWSDDGNFIIEGFVKTVCGGAKITGNYSLSGNDLTLKYQISTSGPVTSCLCARKAIYEFKNIDHKDYNITLIED